MLEHGGRLQKAARQYGIPVAEWLDLSTGLNPLGWPVPPVPEECWLRLPEDDDGLLEAARDYYGTDSLLAMSGSQAAIQLLPQLRPRSRVAVVTPSYAEHAYQWRFYGHEVVEYRLEQMETAVEEADVVIIVNPNNPSGDILSRDTLLRWHVRLARKGGWLIVDEAFMDSYPCSSLAFDAGKPGLIILRSLGKFFGLAGLRAGFLLAEESLLQSLNEMQGPWPLATASRWLARAALADGAWQAAARERLQHQEERLAILLRRAGFNPRGTALFQWLRLAQAREVHDYFARQGILLRLFEAPQSLRFGLPGEESEWQRLEQALKNPELKRLCSHPRGADLSSDTVAG